MAILPVGSALFLLYVAWQSIATNLGGWGSRSMVYLYIMLAVGVAVMLYSRLRAESDYFDLPIEAYQPSSPTDGPGLTPRQAP